MTTNHVVQFNTVYDDVRPGVEYPVIEEGYDFVKVRAKGKPLCVPSFLIWDGRTKNYEPAINNYEEYDQDYENYYGSP